MSVEIILFLCCPISVEVLILDECDRLLDMTDHTQTNSKLKDHSHIVEEEDADPDMETKKDDSVETSTAFLCGSSFAEQVRTISIEDVNVFGNLVLFRSIHISCF